MREEDLRKVLLVKAVEEADADGTLIPPADRIAAARDAMRAAPGDEQAMMVSRARTLIERIAARHPFVTRVLDLLGGGWGLTVALALLGLVAGAALSALDGSRRINILAFPLAGIVAWNLVVYAAIAWTWLRRRPRPGSLLRAGIGSLGTRLAASRIAQAGAFHAPLAAALRNFAQAWREAAAPLLIARATRAFHLAAAALGAGLIAGLYVRGIVFDYQAGWESTFLDAPRARALLVLLYGPASWLTGIPIPDAVQLEATRWRSTGGGEPAARWIHLMAASALIYVVVPRLLLALAAGARVVRLSLRAPVPESLTPYFRNAFAAIEGAVRPARAIILPFAHELSPGALARLIAWVPSITGGTPEVDALGSVAYGEEDRYLAELHAAGDSANIVVLAFSLAATPEDENHGAVLAAVRDHLGTRKGTQLLVAIDEAPYAQRMAAAPGRIEERRAAWRAFVEARGVQPHFVSLA